MGTLLGVTGATWIYIYQGNKGFSILPYHKSKWGRYALLLGGYMLFYKVGSSYVGSLTSEVN